MKKKCWLCLIRVLFNCLTQALLMPALISVSNGRCVVTLADFLQECALKNSPKILLFIVFLNFQCEFYVLLNNEHWR